MVVVYQDQHEGRMHSVAVCKNSSNLAMPVM